MRCCVRLGHYYVEGVGYATIQAILTGNLASAGAAAAAVRRQAVCHLGQPRLRRLRRHLFAVAVHGRDARRRLRRGGHRARPRADGVDVTTCAIVGMAAMVGGGTGAAMTAVTMIFEMTRDYDHRHADHRRGGARDRRAAPALAREHLHHQAGRRAAISCPRRCTPTCSWCAAPARSWTRDVVVLPAEADFDAFLREHATRRRLQARRGHARQSHRRRAARQHRTAARRRSTPIPACSSATIAQRNFTLAREDDIVFDVVQRMARHSASMAVVIKSRRPRPAVRDRRRDLQGAHRRFSRRQHQAIRLIARASGHSPANRVASPGPNRTTEPKTRGFGRRVPATDRVLLAQRETRPGIE